MSDHVRIPQGATHWRFEITSEDATLERVAAYLPSNYRVHEQLSLVDDHPPLLIVTGVDVEGWTHKWVRERLMSGLIASTVPTRERRCGA